MHIVCDSGNFSAQWNDYLVEYYPKSWILRINPKLLMPGFVRNDRYNIYLNGAYWGYGEYRNGCIPIPSRRVAGDSLSVRMLNFVREHLGILCPDSDRGYFYVKSRHYSYVITRQFTNMGNTFYTVYYNRTKDKIATIVVNSQFTEVYYRVSIPNWKKSLYIIAGYLVGATSTMRALYEFSRDLSLILENNM